MKNHQENTPKSKSNPHQRQGSISSIKNNIPPQLSNAAINNSSNEDFMELTAILSNQKCQQKESQHNLPMPHQIFQSQNDQNSIAQRNHLSGNPSFNSKQVTIDNGVNEYEQNFNQRQKINIVENNSELIEDQFNSIQRFSPIQVQKKSSLKQNNSQTQQVILNHQGQTMQPSSSNQNLRYKKEYEQRMSSQQRVLSETGQNPSLQHLRTSQNMPQTLQSYQASSTYQLPLQLYSTQNPPNHLSSIQTLSHPSKQFDNLTNHTSSQPSFIPASHLSSQQQQQVINSNTDYLLDRINQLDQRLKSTENNQRISDEMLKLKKEEVENQKIIKESQYEELLNRNSFLEKRIQNLESQINRHELQINQTIPQQIGKTFEKVQVQTEHLKDEIEEQLTIVMNKGTQQMLEMKEFMEKQILQFKSYNESKILMMQKESEKQLHEVISMVEDIAKMSKNLEVQLNQKKPETENILLNLVNVQRRIDENSRIVMSEITQLKQRQYKLFNLYNTGLETSSNNQSTNNLHINQDQQKLSLAELETQLNQNNILINENQNVNLAHSIPPQILFMESTGKFAQSQGGKENYGMYKQNNPSPMTTQQYHRTEKKSGADSFGISDAIQNHEELLRKYQNYQDTSIKQNLRKQ